MSSSSDDNSLDELLDHEQFSPNGAQSPKAKHHEQMFEELYLSHINKASCNPALKSINHHNIPSLCSGSHDHRVIIPAIAMRMRLHIFFPSKYSGSHDPGVINPCDRNEDAPAYFTPSKYSGSHDPGVIDLCDSYEDVPAYFTPSKYSGSHDHEAIDLCNSYEDVPAYFTSSKPNVSVGSSVNMICSPNVKITICSSKIGHTAPGRSSAKRRIPKVYQ